MPKIVKIYLVDHPQVKRMLINQLQLQLKRGVYEKIDENAITRLLYFDKETILEKSIIADPAYIALKKLKMLSACSIITHLNQGIMVLYALMGLPRGQNLQGKWFIDATL